MFWAVYKDHVGGILLDLKNGEMASAAGARKEGREGERQAGGAVPMAGAQAELP